MQSKTSSIWPLFSFKNLISPVQRGSSPRQYGLSFYRADGFKVMISTTSFDLFLFHVRSVKLHFMLCRQRREKASYRLAHTAVKVAEWIGGEGISSEERFFILYCRLHIVLLYIRSRRRTALWCGTQSPFTVCVFGERHDRAFLNHSCAVSSSLPHPVPIDTSYRDHAWQNCCQRKPWQENLFLGLPLFEQHGIITAKQLWYLSFMCVYDVETIFYAVRKDLTTLKGKLL